MIELIAIGIIAFVFLLFGFCMGQTHNFRECMLRIDKLIEVCRQQQELLKRYADRIEDDEGEEWKRGTDDE